jgi:hypothetical protein
MIVFFVTHGARAPLREFFGVWGARVPAKLVYYERLTRRREVPGADVYVFTDLERLTPEGLRLTSELADTLGGPNSAARIVNHPREVLLRYEFMRTLHERGINPVGVHRALSVPADLRYPVFVRNEHEHRVLTPLLESREGVEQQLARFRANGVDPGALLLVEFVDVADEDGLYHRHVTHVIGDAIVPGYLAFGPNWEVKFGPFLEGERLDRQRASVLSAEHEPVVRKLAELACVGYGRFDYAVADGKIVVWELNTNPTLLLLPREMTPSVLEEMIPFADRLASAFERLVGESTGRRPPVRFRAPSEPLVVRPARELRSEPLRTRLRLAPAIAPTIWIGERRRIRKGNARRAARAAEL